MFAVLWWPPACADATDVAYALFTFPSLAAYERYREAFGTDPDFVAADAIRERSGCVRRYERTFLRPVLEPLDLSELERG